MMALIVGLIVTVVSVIFGLRFIPDVITVLKGALPLMFLCGGILAMVAGSTSIRDESETKKTEDEQNAAGK